VSRVDWRRKSEIRIPTFAVVAFSVIVQGLTAPLAIKALRVAPRTVARRQRAP
jgi:NhaP-type Na+/H+ or K+/H+ antiporter